MCQVRLRSISIHLSFPFLLSWIALCSFRSGVKRKSARPITTGALSHVHVSSKFGPHTTAVWFPLTRALCLRSTEEAGDDSEAEDEGSEDHE